MSLDFYLYEIGRVNVFDRNITHNLTKMASEAGIYKALWRPKENGYELGKDIIKILEKGLTDLKDRPEYFEQFNSPNGWGSYKYFVPFVEAVLDACKEYPDKMIHSCV